MPPEEASTADELAGNPFAAGDVANILRERGWLAAEPSPEHLAWCEHSAAILGGHVADRDGLEYLLSLIFRYDARDILKGVDAHVVLSRFGARDVVRQLALLLLEGGPLGSERFNEIIGVLKENLDVRGRELFHPIRLALTGRAGEGELDRVILLLDEAAGLSFAVRVKSARERILEFCTALD
jgi:nondiscriminating glutamyl-tRNA synthetase